MSASFNSTQDEFGQTPPEVQPSILTIGCGGAGGNTISRIFKSGLKGVRTIAVNTDAQDLLQVNADKKILIGRSITGGLGAGADPKVGKEAAVEEEDALRKAISDYELVFVTYGLGGGTGTGSGPVISEIAKATGALVVGIVTLPFGAEGEKRNKNANKGLSELRRFADTVIVIHDDKLLEVAPDLSLEQAFEMADKTLMNTINGIIELMTEPGLINLGLNDVKTIFRDGGIGVVGFGEASGEDRAFESAKEALNNPLLDIEVKNARKALVSVIGCPDMTLGEAEKVAETVEGEMSPDCYISFGARVSDNLEEIIRSMVIITGATSKPEKPSEIELDLEMI